EPEGTLGTVCIYQATSPEAIRQHAEAVGMPATEIFLVADPVIVRPDPEPEKPAHHHPTTHPGGTPKALAPIIAEARLATAKYATSLGAARKAGYTVNVTQMIPDMGWHFLNPKISGFDPNKPPILVYEKRGKSWHLAAIDWVSTEK